MAQGLLSIDGQEDVAAALLAAAVDDRRIPADRFRQMAQLFGRDKLALGGSRTALRERVQKRLDAAAWYETLRKAALTKGPSRRYAELQERLCARYLLGLASRWRLALVQTQTIRAGLAGLERCDHFAPWLLARFDVRRVVFLKNYLTVRTGIRLFSTAVEQQDAVATDFAAAILGHLTIVVAFPRRWWTRHRRDDPPTGSSLPLAAAEHDAAAEWSMREVLADIAAKQERGREWQKKFGPIVASVFILLMLALGIATLSPWIRW